MGVKFMYCTYLCTCTCIILLFTVNLVKYCILQILHFSVHVFYHGKLELISHVYIPCHHLEEFTKLILPDTCIQLYQMEDYIIFDIFLKIFLSGPDIVVELLHNRSDRSFLYC